MIKENKVFVKVNSRNVKHYKELGYNIDVGFQESKKLEVLTKDIPKNSTTKITAICDICGNERSLMLLKYYSNFKRKGFYSCFSCKNIKKEITTKMKYGVASYSQTDEFKEKYKSTCMEKYGVENPNMLSEFREKIKKTCLEKYGVTTHLILPKNLEISKKWMSSDKFKEMSKKTLIEKYGVDSFSKTNEFKDIIQSKKEVILDKMKSTFMEKYGEEYYSRTDDWKNKYLEKLEEISAKRENTCLEKYGVENVSQCPDIYDKIIKSKIKNNLIISDDEIDSWNLYKRNVRRVTNKNKKKLFENWNGLDYYDNEKIIGYLSLNHTHRFYPTIDHRISVFYGYKNNLDYNLIGSLDNLCITKRYINSIKRTKIDVEFNLKYSNTF